MGIQEPSPATASVSQVMTAAAMNAIRDQITALAAPPHFKGSITSATALTTGTNIAYPSIEDNYTGWDSTNHWWKVPAGWPGLYIVSCQFKWGTGPASAPAVKILGGAANTTALVTSPNAAAITSFGGVWIAAHFVRLAVGDEISVQLTGSGFTTQSDSPADNNFFDIGFYSE